MVGVVYYGKCNYYVLINLHHTVLWENSLIWDKNLGSTGWPVAEPLCIRPCQNNSKNKEQKILRSGTFFFFLH